MVRLFPPGGKARTTLQYQSRVHEHLQLEHLAVAAPRFREKQTYSYKSPLRGNQVQNLDHNWGKAPKKPSMLAMGVGLREFV